jgi:hypothetical protein
MPFDPIDPFSRHYSPVPNEFRGMARQVHAQLLGTDQTYKSALISLFPLLQGRLNMGKLRLRPENISKVRDTLDVAPFGQRPRIHITQHKKTGFNIRIGRLMASRVAAAHWDSFEDGVLVTVHELKPEWQERKGEWGWKLTYNAANVVCVDLHAMARYFQRAFQPTSDNLFAAIWSVYDAMQPLCAEFDDTAEKDFAVPAGGGLWRGDLCHMSLFSSNPANRDRATVVAHTRTFTPDGGDE